MTDLDPQAFRHAIASAKAEAFKHLNTQGLDAYHRYVHEVLFACAPDTPGYDAAHELTYTEAELRNALSSKPGSSAMLPRTFGDMIVALDAIAHAELRSEPTHAERSAILNRIENKAREIVSTDKSPRLAATRPVGFQGFSYETDFAKLRGRRAGHDAIQVSLTVRHPACDATGPKYFVIRETEKGSSPGEMRQSAASLKTALQSASVRVHSTSPGVAIVEGSRQVIEENLANLGSDWKCEPTSDHPRRKTAEIAESAARRVRMRAAGLLSKPLSDGERVTFYVPMDQISKLGDYVSALKYEGIDISRHEIESLRSIIPVQTSR